MKRDPFISALLSGAKPTTNLGRVAVAMRSSERWLRAPIEFPQLEPVSGEIEAK